MVAVKPLTVHWHQDSAPIYSACFQPREEAGAPPPPGRTHRLATAGGDNNVRLWRLRVAGADEPPGVEYLATLAKHERAVNVVAFDASGRVLASAGDDGVVCLWTRQESAGAPAAAFGADTEDTESWRMVRKCRSASFGEIYDLAWSPSGRFLAATSMDKIVSILDTADGTCIAALRDHRHYVQGVAWDPRGEFLATQSSDQRVLVYALREDKGRLAVDAPVARLDRTELPGGRQSGFHPESFSSFFRRLSFSPDGALLVAPAAQIDQKTPAAQAEQKPSLATQPTNPSVAAQQAEQSTGPAPATRQSEQSIVPEPMDCGSEPVPAAEPASASVLAPASKPASTPGPASGSAHAPVPASEAAPAQNCALIYARSDLRRPAGIVPLPRQSMAVRFCPVQFQRAAPPDARGLALPYKMVYAIATLNGVFIYDTESAAPLGMASNLHYSSLTDLAWSPDGRMLLLTSIDGFCSVLRFEPGELGEPYTADSGAAAPAEPAESAEPAPALRDTSPAVPVVNVLAARRKPRPAPSSDSNSAVESSQRL